MVEDDEVAGLEVEAVQAVARALGVINVLVDDVRGALGVGCNALADLSGRCVSAMLLVAPGVREVAGRRT